MNQVLNQEEINALLNGLNEGDQKVEEQAPSAKDRSADKYDITNQEKIIRGRMPGLEAINDRFARTLKISLYKFISKTCYVSISGLEIIKFGTYIKKIAQPASLHIFRMPPLQGYAMIELSTPFIFSAIDTLFGGNGRSRGKIEGREFTPIESRLISKITMIVLETMREAWSPVHAVDFVYVRSEINPVAAAIAAPTDVAIITKIDIEFENESSSLTICIPYSVIEPLRQKLTFNLHSAKMEIDNVTRSKVIQNLMLANVSLQAELAKGEVKAKQISNLQVGDILQLETSPTELTNIFIEGIPKFKGKVGTYHGSRAIKVLKDILPAQQQQF